jgi:hypothetical protein
VVLRFGRHARERRGIMPGSPLNRANAALNRVVATGEWGTVTPKGDLSQFGRHRCNLLSQFAGVEHQPILAAQRATQPSAPANPRYIRKAIVGRCTASLIASASRTSVQRNDRFAA